MLEESLVKLCLEHSQSLSEATLSENQEESESLGWSSPTHCFSPLKGILGHLSVGLQRERLQRQIDPMLAFCSTSTDRCFCRAESCACLCQSWKAQRTTSPSHRTRPGYHQGFKMPSRKGVHLHRCEFAQDILSCECGAALSSNRSFKIQCAEHTPLPSSCVAKTWEGRVGERDSGVRLPRLEAPSVFCQVTLGKSLNHLPH